MQADYVKDQVLRPPLIISERAHSEFVSHAESMGLDPENPWIGGYVDYEWNHLRPIINAYGIEVESKRILEFGSNLGASAIVFSQLGANVEAVDVTVDYIALAKKNAEQYGLGKINFQYVPDTRRLPFEDASIDIVSCNSVLEYVHADQLSDVQAEIHRVLKPGGLILVTGTSSRLWPREIHSGLWLTNYMPRYLDRILFKKPKSRGVWPWRIRNGFGKNYINLDADGGRAFIQARAKMNPRKDGNGQRLAASFARFINISPGLMMSNISCLLKKPPID